MKYIISLFAGVLVTVGTMSWAEEPPCDVGKPTYAIECRIFGVDREGNELAIMAPRISVYEGQEASVRDVSQIPRPGKSKDIVWLEEGTSIDVKVFRDDEGQRYLDARVQFSGRPAETSAQQDPLVRRLAHYIPNISSWLRQPAPEQPAGVRLLTRAVNLVEPVKLGETIVVPLENEGKLRVELKVTELASKAVPLALPAKSSGDLILGGVRPRIIIREEEEEQLGVEIP